MVKPKISGQNQVKELKPYLVCNLFAKGFFWFKGVFCKHPLRLVLTILLQRKIDFCQKK